MYKNASLKHFILIFILLSGVISPFNLNTVVYALGDPPGTLDNLFDNDGLVTTPIGSSDDEARAVAIQPDGKIVVAGRFSNPAYDDFFIARYSDNGSLDTSFDTDGIVTTNFGGDDVARAMVIQDDGKIVVAGYTASLDSSTADFALARYNTDGSLDTSFDSDGKVITSLGSGYDYPSGVSIQPDGKIVVVGGKYSGINDYDVAVLRYNVDGSLDTTFDTDGIVITAIGSSRDNYGVSINIDTNNKIVVGGNHHNGSNADFLLLRYNPNGSLDTSFDVDGFVIQDFGIGFTLFDRGAQIAIQEDGKIVAAGHSDDGYFLVARYNENGTLDTSFDADGLANTIGSGVDNIRGIALQENGKIIIAGYSSVDNDFAVLRYNTNGSLDSTFSSDGKVFTDFGNNEDDLGNAVAIQSDGKVVVAGYRYISGSNYDVAVARYWGDDPPSSLIVTKVEDTNDGTCNSDCSLQEAIDTASDGSIVIFSSSLSGQTIHLQSTLTIDKNITIDASALSEKIIISGDSDNDGNGDILILNILANQVVTIRDVEFTRGYRSSGLVAGAIENLGDLSVYDSEFHFNSGEQGGAIRNSGNLYIEDSTFTNNTALEGGAILNNLNAEAEIRTSVFANNSTSGQYATAGAIGNIGVLSIYDSEFTSNSAPLGGGAIVNAINGTATISNSAFTSNSTTGDGGAIYNSEGTVHITQSTFTSNSANYGGAIIAGSVPNGPNTTTTISESVISNNQATTGGGGIEFDSGTSMTIDKTTISGNTALAGGGIVNVSGNLLTITNSTIANNTSTQSPQPGGILSLFSPVTIKNSTFTGNNHTAVGIQGNAIISNTTIAGNSGYGLEVHNYSLSITNSILANNTNFDCRTQNGATVTTNQNNLIETNSGCGTPASTADPLLDALADNGGLTQTMALQTGSPAISAGNNTTCESTDQRGVARPQDVYCDMGAYEYQEFPPEVESITRVNASPIGAQNISFSVIFSEAVTSVDIEDFALATSGVSGASITNVSGTGSTYTVVVNTGTGSGTIKLNLIDNDSIIDNASIPLGGVGSGNGSFTTGETYTITKTYKTLPAPRIPRTMFRLLTNDTTPTLLWLPVNGAFEYEITIATDRIFSSIVITDTVSTSIFTPSAPLTDGIYYWRVRGLNEISQAGKISVIQTLTIDTTPPAIPTLTSPMNEAKLKRSPILRWTRVTGGVLYELQVANNVDFNNPTTYTLRTNSRNLPALPDDVYYWRVRAKDAAGNWSDWSIHREFEIDR